MTRGNASVAPVVSITNASPEAANPPPRLRGRGPEGATSDNRPTPSVAPARSRAGAPRPARRHGRGQYRVCARCKQSRPAIRFPLLNDPTAVMRRHATRLWCEDCLIERGHLRRVTPPAEVDAPTPVIKVTPRLRRRVEPGAVGHLEPELLGLGHRGHGGLSRRSRRGSGHPMGRSPWVSSCTDGRGPKCRIARGRRGRRMKPRSAA